MPSEFVNTEYLFTFVGMVLILGLVVQFTKGFFKRSLQDWVVRAYAFGWAIVLVVAMYWHQGLFDAAAREIAITLLLALLNAIIITMATIGGYEVMADPRAEKTK